MIVLLHFGKVAEIVQAGYELRVQGGSSLVDAEREFMVIYPKAHEALRVRIPPFPIQFWQALDREMSYALRRLIITACQLGAVWSELNIAIGYTGPHLSHKGSESSTRALARQPANPELLID